MRTNIFRVLPLQGFCYSLCTTVTGILKFRKTGGVEESGKICNYVICYMTW